jgi:hypothetical protein
MTAELKLLPPPETLKKGRTEEQRLARREQWKLDMADPVKGPHLRALAAANEKKWRERHPETNRKRSREWQERFRKEKAYGVSLEEFERLLVFQNGVCAVCRQPETATRNGKAMKLAVDHHHDSGLVRGLLCTNCNNGIGRFGDDPARLRAAADYLEKAK